MHKGYVLDMATGKQSVPASCNALLGQLGTGYKEVGGKFNRNGITGAFGGNKATIEKTQRITGYMAIILCCFRHVQRIDSHAQNLI